MQSGLAQRTGPLRAQLHPGGVVDDAAMAAFRRSVTRWKPLLTSGFPWLDRYRQVLLLSPSGASYHETALINQGVCLVHLNRGPDGTADL